MKMLCDLETGLVRLPSAREEHDLVRLGAVPLTLCQIGEIKQRLRRVPVVTNAVELSRLRAKGATYLPPDQRSDCYKYIAMLALAV